MAIQKPEWFKVDPAKFLSDGQVDAMSTPELGACFRLLCRQWIDGYIPDDSRRLARLCRLDDAAMGEAWLTLCHFFPVVEPGKRANRFMWIEREKVVTELERRSDEGTRAARKRWDTARLKLNATPNGCGMPVPMQDQTRPEQTRPEKPFLSELKGSSDLFPESLEVRQPVTIPSLSKSKESFEQALQQDWDYYIVTAKRHPKLYLFSDTRKKLGRARLRECFELASEPKLQNAVNLFKIAIDRFSASPYHNGVNSDGKKYLEWELLCRNREKFMYWLDDSNHRNGGGA